MIRANRPLRLRRTRFEKLIAAASAFVASAETETVARPASSVVVAETSAAVASRDGSTVVVVPHHGEIGSWTTTLLNIIYSAKSGLTYGELKQEVQKTHLGEVLTKTDKAFYGGVGKLEERKKIVKHNRRLYSPVAFQKFLEDVAQGRAQDIPAPAVGEESANEVALDRFLSARPDGATAAEIVDHLLNNPPPDLAVTRVRNSIYNLLARHRGRGKLIRRGNRALSQFEMIAS